MSDCGPIRIGIAGGIGSGKSTVARAFGELGCEVIDSDALSRRALERPEVVAELVSWWGPGILAGNGAGVEGGASRAVIDRRAVGKIVFSDAAERARLEGLIHPLIESQRHEMIEDARSRGVRAVVIDAPLLFEAGLDGEMDAIVFVDTPFEERARRVRLGRGWGEQGLRKREKAQCPLEEKRRRSDYCIVNGGGVEGLGQQVARILTQIIETHIRDC